MTTTTPTDLTRFMARLRWAILLATALVAAGSWWTLVIHAPAPTHGPARYYCPMHPAITSPDPGTCPICSMTLERIPDERVSHDARAERAAQPALAEPTPLAPIMLSTERRQAIGVASAPVRRETVQRTLRMAALAALPEDATTEVRLRVSGFVERVAPLTTGQAVTRGAVLADVYAADWTQAAEELLASARLTRGASIAAGRARARLLRLGLDVADVDAVVAAGVVPHTFPLRAPRDGTIVERAVNAGAYVGPEVRLFAIASLSRLWIDAQLSASDAARLPAGAIGTWIPASGRGPERARLSRVVPRAEADTRTLTARFELVTDPRALRPGEAGELVLELAPERHLLAPRDAVVDVGLERYVFVDREDGAFEPRRVELGALYGEQRAIVAGLEEGERVVTKGLFLVDSESRLQAALRPRVVPPPKAEGHDAHEGHR
jgi:Cu(I)/Ag(I) efflux system membrane fusion protein